MRLEYGVRRYGGHIDPRVSKHVAAREVEALVASGVKNVWLVERYVSDWARSEIESEDHDSARIY